MSTRKITFTENEYYHLYNRGVDKRIIFLDNRDYERFLSLIYLSNSTKRFELNKNEKDWSLERSLEKDTGDHLVSIGAWCLMPNHFHFLIKEETLGGVSKFMLKLLTGYSMYFNKKYFRTGALFEGAFKASHANSDRYLKYLYSYIHLNPIGIIDNGWKQRCISDVARAKNFLKEFDYSSYKDYVEKNRLESKIINRENFPAYFENIKQFEDMHEYWLTEEGNPPLIG